MARLADHLRRQALASLKPYSAPSYARHLAAPHSRIPLGIRNTPIHPWCLPDIPADFELSIKRDDMTGSVTGGNKVRKLEFLLADALLDGVDHIITCGGEQSNHCRITALLARQIGLECSLVLRSEHHEQPSAIGYSGNVLLSSLVGARMYAVPPVSYEKGLKPRMEALARQATAEHGHKCMLVPVGGSNTRGLWGYIDAYSEIVDAGVSDVVVTVGSGSTAAGLAIANHLAGSPMRIHAMAVCDGPAYFHQHINGQLRELGITNVRSESIVNIITAKGRGYGLSTDSELDFVKRIAAETGIILDRCYTGKAAMGLQRQLQTNASVFQGKQVLFWHTGGAFGLYDGEMSRVMNTSPVVSFPNDLLE